MNILITGGAGYIGSHVLNLLSKQTDHNLFVYDNLSTGRKESVVVGELIQADLEDLETLESVITSKILMPFFILPGVSLFLKASQILLNIIKTIP